MRLALCGIQEHSDEWIVHRGEVTEGEWSKGLHYGSFENSSLGLSCSQGKLPNTRVHMPPGDSSPLQHPHLLESAYGV